MTQADSAQNPSKPLSARERLEARKRSQPAAESATQFSLLQRIRGTIDALVLAYVIAMFIRSYVFELYMIPTGSMTPTLIGDSDGLVAMDDYNNDGVTDVIYTNPLSMTSLQIYLMQKDGTYSEELFLSNVDPSVTQRLMRTSRRRTDMIVVNKFAYWFAHPTRGDIAVFKVPDRPNAQRGGASVYEPTKPVYIKRVLGEPGETVTIQPGTAVSMILGNPARRGSKYGGLEHVVTGGNVLVNGAPIKNERIDTIVHFPPPSGRGPVWAGSGDHIIQAGEDGVLMVGDNAASSLDSRYWGDVPLSHMRGRAAVRYWPLKAFTFFE